MRNEFYKAIETHVSSYDDCSLTYGKGSAAEECENVFKNELSRILLALSCTNKTPESVDTFIQEIRTKYEL